MAGCDEPLGGNRTNDTFGAGTAIFLEARAVGVILGDMDGEWPGDDAGIKQKGGKE